MGYLFENSLSHFEILPEPTADKFARSVGSWAPFAPRSASCGEAGGENVEGITCNTLVPIQEECDVSSIDDSLVSNDISEEH